MSVDNKEPVQTEWEYLNIPVGSVYGNPKSYKNWKTKPAKIIQMQFIIQVNIEELALPFKEKKLDLNHG